MNHVAIMKKSWHLLPEILSGEKTIESRWYKNKSAPWGKVKAGDTVYFKDAGEPVTAKAVVAKVLALADLTPTRVKELLAHYGKAIGIPAEEIAKFSEIRSAGRRIVSRADPDPAEPVRA